jgi:hypothetical protein
MKSHTNKRSHAKKRSSQGKKRMHTKKRSSQANKRMHTKKRSQAKKYRGGGWPFKKNPTKEKIIEKLENKIDELSKMGLDCDTITRDDLSVPFESPDTSKINKMIEKLEKVIVDSNNFCNNENTPVRYFGNLPEANPESRPRYNTLNNLNRAKATINPVFNPDSVRSTTSAEDPYQNLIKTDPLKTIYAMPFNKVQEGVYGNIPGNIPKKTNRKPGPIIESIVYDANRGNTTRGNYNPFEEETDNPVYAEPMRLPPKKKQI